MSDNIKKIGVIDYQMGNLFSVIQALKKVGLNVELITNCEDILDYDGIVLPGVGAFAEAMKELQQMNFDKAILKFNNLKRPILGICLGFQLLFDHSEEFKDTNGLGILKGKVLNFNQKIAKRVPHMGWSTLEVNDLKNSPMSHIKKDDKLFFVHSLYAHPTENKIILSKTRYHDFEFTSSILDNNIFATQFHPEKSGSIGLEIFNNWSRIFNLK